VLYTDSVLPGKIGIRIGIRDSGFGIEQLALTKKVFFLSPHPVPLPKGEGTFGWGYQANIMVFAALDIPIYVSISIAIAIPITRGMILQRSAFCLPRYTKHAPFVGRAIHRLGAAWKNRDRDRDRDSGSSN